jgi:hypothetical protein
MSDTMLFGVLKMPYEMAMRDEISRIQFYQRVQELVARVEAQPEQEPEAPKCGAIIEVFDKDWRLEYLSLPVGKHKLYTQQYTYTTPPAAQRPWVGLTEAEVDRCWNMTPMDTHNSRHMFAYAIESKLKEKNTT